jgi:hypothetical protein
LTWIRIPDSKRALIGRAFIVHFSISIVSTTSRQCLNVGLTSDPEEEEKKFTACAQVSRLLERIMRALTALRANSGTE